MNVLKDFKEFVITAFAVAIILCPLMWHVYSRGMVDGVAHYKKSKQFRLTLFSMYRYGVSDGCTDDHICDMYGFLGEEGGNR